MKYLGIDYGTKRIGLAVSDVGGALAFPLLTIAAGEGAVGEVLAIMQKEGAEKIVLGESRNYQGGQNAVAAPAERFKQALEAAGASLVYEPEFMTSMQVERLGGSQDIDASAAAIILQSYLDRIKNLPAVE